MKIGLIGGLFVWLWMLAMPFSVQCAGPRSRVHESEGRYLCLCSQGRELDMQRRIDRGRTGDHRHLPKAARHAPFDGRREEAHG